MRSWRYGIGVLLIVALCVALFVTPTVASDTVQINGHKVTALLGPTLSHYRSKAAGSSDYATTVAKLPKGVKLDTANTYANRIDDTTFVYTPLIGADKGSNVYTAFRPDGTVITGAVLSMAAGDARHGMVLQGGRQVMDGTFTNDGQLQSGWSEMTPGQRAPLRPHSQLRPGAHPDLLNWGCFNNFLASQGINWTLINLVTLYCSLACATLAGCPICVGLIVGLTIGTIARGVYQCWTWAW